MLLAALLIASAQQTANTPQTAPQKKGTAAPAKGASAKQTPGQPATKKVFSFSTNVQLVVVDAFIKDKNGNPIPNLKAGDFTITEDGKPQEIKLCEFQELKTDPIAAEAAPALTPRAEEAPKPAAEIKAVTATQITPAQAGKIKYKDKRLMVMFFDMTSMPIQDQIRAQDSAIKFVKAQITASDLVAIMSFSSDVKVVEDFTDDRDQLIKDIKDLTIGEGQGFDISDTSDSATDTGAAFTADDSEFNIFNTDRQLSALETAAKMLGIAAGKEGAGLFRQRHHAQTARQ